jgi:ParB family chromosome partitioning protein
MSQEKRDIEYVRQVPVDQIQVPQDRVTSVFDPEILQELEESIKERGIRVPLSCLEVNGVIWLIDGLHRLQIAKKLGMKTVPCIVRKGEEADLYVENLIMNRQRGRSNPAEEAKLIRKLKDEFGWPWKEISKRLGLSIVTVKDLYDVSFLPEEVLDLIKHGKLGITKAKLLCQVPDPRDQVKLANMIVMYGYTESQAKLAIEEYLKALAELPAPPAPTLKRPEAESWIYCEICSRPMKETPSYHWICDDCWNMLMKAIHEAEVEKEVEEGESDES